MNGPSEDDPSLADACVFSKSPGQASISGNPLLGFIDGGRQADHAMRVMYQTWLHGSLWQEGTIIWVFKQSPLPLPLQTPIRLNDITEHVDRQQCWVGIVGRGEIDWAIEPSDPAPC